MSAFGLNADRRWRVFGRIAAALLVVLEIASAHSVAAQSIRGVELPSDAQSMLREVMEMAGVESVVVTRTRSSPADQVRVMYNFIRRYGADAAYRMYGSEGDAVVAAYESESGNAEAKRAAMLAELERQLPNAREHGRLMHVNDQYVVFDLSLSRFAPADSVDAFIRIAREHPLTRRVLGRDEGEKEAIHVELTK